MSSCSLRCFAFSAVAILMGCFPALVASDAAPGGRVYYLSPGGSDGAVGTTRDEPWRTFGRLLQPGVLGPGDTIILLDGTYTPDTTGLPRIECGDGGKAPHGTPSAPITIRAEHERQAWLKSDGRRAAFEMVGCAWWRVEGLRAQNADNPSASFSGGFPFHFKRVEHIELRRLLGSHNNRAFNTHVFAVEKSKHVLLEECEAYYFHRHAFSVWQSRYVTLRRVYANSMRYGARGCCSQVDNQSYGDEAISLYGTSDSVVENSVSENFANGFQIHGIASETDPSGNGGRRNRVLGSISFGDAVPALVASRASGPGSYHNAMGNVFRDFVALDAVGNGLFLRAAADTVVENATLWGSTENSGLVADAYNSSLGATCSTELVCSQSGSKCTSEADCSGAGVCTRNLEGCGFRATNVLAAFNKGFGFQVHGQTWAVIEFADAYGNAVDYGLREAIDDGEGIVRWSRQQPPLRPGPPASGCPLWPPAGSPLARGGKGQHPVGATVLYRYVDGVLTDRPLWDPATGSFPCGAVVPGVNGGDVSCRTLHKRLRINTVTCPFPAGYGS